jgi:rSAM/selenodomain-associated transferase 1
LLVLLYCLNSIAGDKTDAITDRRIIGAIRLFSACLYHSSTYTMLNQDRPLQDIRTIIFAKAPVPGLAKTRLTPALGADGAAQLAHQLLQHTLKEALAADIGPVELCVTPTSTHPDWQLPLPQMNVQWSDQGDGDLGARLSRGAKRALLQQEMILIIGTDCPELDRARLAHAASALKASDTCFFPVYDGGFALVGLKKFHPSLFQDVAWSTDQVMARMRTNVGRLGWSLAELETLHDIDEPEDLVWVPRGWEMGNGEREAGTSGDG